MTDKNMPDDELIKEVFALFGRTYYYGECLHRELCNAHALAGFRTATDMTGPRLEERLKVAFSATLGQIVRELQPRISQDLFARMNAAVERRNFLAHHFWFERCHLLISEEGLDHMREELAQISDLFCMVDKECSAAFEPHRRALGVSEDVEACALAEVLAGKAMEPFTKQRLPHKQEKILSVWQAPTETGGVTLIFESEDGCLWQLCESGLGWPPCQNREPSWKPYAPVQRHLPARINPRPPVSEPWNYDFVLGNGTRMSVTRGRHDKSFRLRIGQPSEETDGEKRHLDRT